jgi:hypothetical protein
MKLVCGVQRTAERSILVSGCAAKQMEGTMARRLSIRLIVIFAAFAMAGCGTANGSDVDSGTDADSDTDADTDTEGCSDEDIFDPADCPEIDPADSRVRYVDIDVADLDEDGDTDEPLPLDLAGAPRVVDGNADDVATVDMGAYEFQP